jgi:hypothetical protein
MMNCRHALLVALMVMGALWCSPIVAFSQGKPDFGALDAAGMPACLIELSSMKKSSGWILDADKPYTVWAAPKKVGQQFFAAAWRPFGPYILGSKQRYIFNWDGASHGGRLATNPEITGTTPILSPALASLHVQNFDGINVWVITNPLPPGCQPNTEGNSKWDKLIGGTHWIVNGHPVPWVFYTGGVVESPGLWKGQWVGQKDRIEITLTANGVRNIFWVTFDERMKSFTAYKDGQVYRQGVRKSDVPPSSPPASSVPNEVPRWKVYGCGMISCTEGGKCGTSISTKPLTVVSSVHRFLRCASVDVHLPDGSDFEGFYELFPGSVVITQLKE